MNYFISISCKKGYDVDLIKPLQNLISKYYNSCDKEEDTKTLDEIKIINELRKNCISKKLDCESALEIYQKYYDQLVSLESKVSLNEIQIPFKWKNAFKKSSSFLYSDDTMTISNIQYEKICVLFNIASISSQICAYKMKEVSNRDSNLKECAKLFQSASGIYQGLKHLVGSIGQELTWDLGVDVLHELSIIMLAQAQEMFFLKASNDGMKNSVIAKICNQCKQLYLDASNDVNILIFDKIQEVTSFKLSIFSGFSQYYQALTCQEEKKFGEQISRLELAIQFFKDAELKGGVVFNSEYKCYLDKILRLYTEAKKDNDFIYHARIPDKDHLELIGKAEIAKPTNIPDRFLKNPDLFSTLLPLAVQQAVIKLDTRNSHLVTTEINDLRDQTQILNALLNSMNLPICIEDINSNSLPSSLLEKHKRLRKSGGYLSIEEKLKKLPDFKQRNEEILKENERQLNEEEEMNENLKIKYGSNWTIFKSKSIFENYKQQLIKYKTIIENANKADKTVLQKYNDNRENIILLSKPEDEFNDLSPVYYNDSNNSNENTKLSLKLLMNEVDELKKERETLEEELKNVTFNDMKSKFLDALKKDGSIDEETLSLEALGKTYCSIQKRIREAKEKQTILVEKIKDSYQEFIKVRNTSNQNQKREKFLSDLSKACDIFFEINVNLDEGFNFYTDLTKLLINLQNKISDYLCAIKTERDEFLKNLEKQGNSIPNLDKKNPNQSSTQYPTQPTTELSNQPSTQGQNLPFIPPYANPYQQFYYPLPPLPQSFNAYPSYYTPGPYNPYSGYPDQSSQQPPQNK